MRRPERIPIVLDNINWLEYLKDLGVEGVDEILVSVSITQNLDTIRTYWDDNPDLRLTQVLIALNLIPNMGGVWFYREETDWLIEKKYLNFEDIYFWGVNYTKEMIKLPKTEFRLLKDLTTEHIRNIVRFVGEQGQSLSPSYLKYFNSRVAQDSQEETENILSNIKPEDE